jgi:hypothetical protein
MPFLSQHSILPLGLCRAKLHCSEYCPVIDVQTAIVNAPAIRNFRAFYTVTLVCLTWGWLVEWSSRRLEDRNHETFSHVYSGDGYRARAGAPTVQPFGPNPPSGRFPPDVSPVGRWRDCFFTSPPGFPLPAFALGTKNRKPRTEPKLSRTEPKNTETEHFGSRSVLSCREPKLPRYVRFSASVNRSTEPVPNVILHRSEPKIPKPNRRYRNRTEDTETKIARYSFLEGTDRYLFCRNRIYIGTEEPYRLVR